MVMYHDKLSNSNKLTAKVLPTSQYQIQEECNNQRLKKQNLLCSEQSHSNMPEPEQVEQNQPEQDV